LVAVAADQVRQWVPFLCHYLLACLLVVVASGDALYIIKSTSRLGWPLKVSQSKPWTLNRPQKLGWPLKAST
jgi:hypothetical protein